MNERKEGARDQDIMEARPREKTVFLLIEFKKYFISLFISLMHLLREFFLSYFSRAEKSFISKRRSIMNRLYIFYIIYCNLRKEPFFRTHIRSIWKSLVDQRISIITTSDDNYALPLGVMLTSLFENTVFRDFIDLYVIEGSLSQSSKQRLLGIAEQYGVNIKFITIDDTKYEDLVTRYYFNIANYYNLAIPDVLSPSIQKALFLDCDLIVKEDIIKIWMIDVTHYFLAAVEDAGVEHWEGWHDLKDRLSIPKNTKYFNSGVMLINLVLWRQNNIHHKVLKFIAENPEIITFLNQDGLNKFLFDKWLPIAPKWNQQPYMFNIIKNSNDLELIDAINKPGIIHFCGAEKPWHPSMLHPFKNEYVEYLSMTRSSISQFI